MPSSDEPTSDLPTNIGQPATRALKAQGYHRLQQLTTLTEAELKKLHGVGPKAIERLRVALEARGLSFSK